MATISDGLGYAEWLQLFLVSALTDLSPAHAGSFANTTYVLSTDSMYSPPNVRESRFQVRVPGPRSRSRIHCSSTLSHSAHGSLAWSLAVWSPIVRPCPAPNGPIRLSLLPVPLPLGPLVGVGALSLFSSCYSWKKFTSLCALLYLVCPCVSVIALLLQRRRIIMGFGRPITIGLSKDGIPHFYQTNSGGVQH